MNIGGGGMVKLLQCDNHGTYMTITPFQCVTQNDLKYIFCLLYTINEQNHK